MIIVPKAFEGIAACFGQDVIQDGLSAPDLVQGAIGSLQRADIPEILDFLQYVTSESVSDAELVEFWRHLPTGIILFDGAGIRRLLHLMREQIGALTH